MIQKKFEELTKEQQYHLMNSIDYYKYLYGITLNNLPANDNRQPYPTRING